MACTIRIPQGSTCGFCRAACTRVYKRRELRRLHPRCDCGFRHLYRGDDPGEILRPLNEYCEALTRGDGELAGLSGKGLQNALKNHKVRIDNDGRPRPDSRRGRGPDQDPPAADPGRGDAPRISTEGADGGGDSPAPPRTSTPGWDSADWPHTDPADPNYLERTPDTEAAVAEARRQHQWWVSREAGTHRAVRSASEAVDGRLERLDTRWKSLNSASRKLADGRGPGGEFDTLNDALRFTVVIDRKRYAAAVAEFVDLIRILGFDADFDFAWNREGYKGINLKVRHPDGRYLEVQMHTLESLDAAERTHPLYDEERRLPAKHPRARWLAGEQERIFSLVPIPPGIDLQ